MSYEAQLKAELVERRARLFPPPPRKLAIVRTESPTPAAPHVHVPREHDGGWTEERVALLAKLWKEGLSASQIARELGQGATKNAVIGKRLRLKLPDRLKNNLGKKKAAQDRQLRKRIIRKLDPMEPRPEGDKTVARGKAWKPLPGIEPVEFGTPHVCKWPIGDDSPFMFCGGKQKPGFSYCETHLARSTRSQVRNDVTPGLHTTSCEIAQETA